jgi:short-subunit dehydrogenase involved in D-alanine esterification of teichoic acids
MAIKDLKKILEQVHEFNEFKLEEVNSRHPNIIWKVPNVKMKDLNIKLHKNRKEHSRFDIFINGQFILERDYITEQKDNDFLVKFIKENFPFNLESDDDIKVEGDIESV